jgi:hypothetical protein
MARRDSLVVALLAATWILFVTAVYAPDVGRGFVKDDFGWIEAGHRAATAPAAAFLDPRVGFYRPLVDLSFAADWAGFGMRPRGYGFTNLALYIACVAAIWWLARTLALSPAAAVLAALIWAVNPHGINMALVWISGRTSLCLTLCAVLAAIALLKGRHALASLAVLAALASKEEAIALPLILIAWHALLITDRGRPARSAIAVLVPLGIYLALRAHAHAFTPGSAPPYYQLAYAPAVVLRNAIEYVDRGATVGAIAVLLAAAALRAVPRVGARGRLTLAGAAWFAGGYLITAFLPIRSSLYAVFPSVGAAIAYAAVIEEMTTSTVAARTRSMRMAAIVAVAVLAAIPIYRARNGRYVEPARLSERALRTIAPEAAAAAPGAAIVLRDAADPLSNFVGAFGTFATNAVRLESGREVNVWIDPPPGDWRLAGLHPAPPDAAAVTFAVDRGRIVQVRY